MARPLKYTKVFNTGNAAHDRRWAQRRDRTSARARRRKHK